LPRTPAEATRRVASGDLPSSGVIALTVEFVAKPKVAQRVKTIIPATIAGAFEGVTGFAGYLVMVSDQEPRLVTVVTLWTGDNRSTSGRENARWVRKLLAPYLDRCLRVQTSFAHLPTFLAIPQKLDPAVERFSPARSAEEDEILSGSAGRSFNPLETTSHDLPKPEQIQAKQSQVHSNHLEESDSQASGKLDDVYGNAELLECSLAH